MTVHSLNVHPVLFSLGGYALVMGCWLITLFVFGRRRRQRIAGLVDLFDPGTADVDQESSACFVRGLFHGCAASVSAGRGLFSEIRTCMTGRFYLPFEFRNARGRWLERAPRALRAARQSVLVCFYIFLLLDRALGPGISLRKSFPVLLDIYWAVWLLIYCYGKLMGYFDEATVATCQVQLAGPGTLPFTSWLPDKFHAAADRREIRDSVTRLLDSCHADSLKAPAQTRLSAKYRNWNFSVQAAWFGRDRFLTKEMVHKTLTDLSSFCAGVEQKFPDATILSAWP